MAIGKQPQQDILQQQREHLRGVFEKTGGNIMSGDYFNEGRGIIAMCKTLLQKPGFERGKSMYSGYSEEELKTMILDNIKRFRSHSEYISDSEKKLRELGLGDLHYSFDEGNKRIIKRLDEIAEEIKGIENVEDPQTLEHILELLKESEKLIYKKV